MLVWAECSTITVTGDLHTENVQQRGCITDSQIDDLHRTNQTDSTGARHHFWLEVVWKMICCSARQSP